MEVFQEITPLRQVLQSQRNNGKKVSLVPTMGALHDGHISLIRKAKSESQFVVCSIFVNPTQFNSSEDLKKYPRTIEPDKQLLLNEGVDALFLPSNETMYSPLHQTSIKVHRFAELYEGEFRPGHFEGVATVVSMLFNIIRPDIAIFGEKDFQQLRIIEELVRDLHFEISIIRGATVREVDGLALSSRNVRLSPAARKASLAINQGLDSARKAYFSGERSASALEMIVQKRLALENNIRPEYVAIVDEQTLSKQKKVSENNCRIILAAWVEDVRLIDNVALQSTLT